MKVEKIEHKHTLTNILKVALFSIFLLLPFIAILPNTLYFAFNEHANEYTQQTINETYEYETNAVNSNNDLIVGNIYKLNVTKLYPSDFNENNIELIYVKGDMFFDGEDLTVDSWTFENFSFNNCEIVLDFYGLDDIIAVDIKLNDNYDNTINIIVSDANLTSTNLYVIYNYGSGLYNNSYEYFSESDYLGEVNYTITENELNPTKAFNYAFNDLENQAWFNWTKNTPLYNGVNSMTTNLGINNNVISMIITYWLILTTIYIIIDIVINLYTLITHIISGRKAS